MQAAAHPARALRKAPTTPNTTVPLDERVNLTVKEGSKRYGVGVTKLYELISQQAFDTIKIGRCRRIVRKSADAYFASLIDRAS